MTTVTNYDDLDTDGKIYYNHGPLAVGPGETHEQAHLRGAIEVMDTVAWFADNDIEDVTTWNPDWSIDDHVAEFDCYDKEPSTCEFVTMDAIVPGIDRVYREGMGCIDDADDNYRRVIELELLTDMRDQIMSSYEWKLKNVDPTVLSKACRMLAHASADKQVDLIVAKDEQISFLTSTGYLTKDERNAILKEVGIDVE